MFGRRRKRSATPPDDRARDAGGPHLGDVGEGVTIRPAAADRERRPVDAPEPEPTVSPIGVDVNPSAQVLDELRGFFGGRSSGRVSGRSGDRSSDHSAPVDTTGGVDPSHPDGVGSPSDAGPAAPDLVPEVTKRSTRRSRKEERREERAEKRRIAAHAKHAPAPGDFDALATEGVRIISAPTAPSTPPATPAPASAVPGSTPTTGPTGEPTTEPAPVPAAEPPTPAAGPAAPDTPAALAQPEADTPVTAGSIPGEPMARWAPPTPPVPADPPTGVLPVTEPATEPATGPSSEPATEVLPVTEPAAAPAAGVEDDSPVPRSTITIVDDVDLPDAVYLDSPDLEAESATPPRVFIDDGPADPAGGPLAVAGTATAAHIEPRLRDRRAQVKKESRKRRLKWVSVVAIVVGVGLASLVVLGSSLFAVDDVRIEGVAYSAGPEFDAILDDLVGTNVFRVDTGTFSSRIEAIPWVESARVNVRFPGTATIEVRERTPAVAYLGADNRYRVLDGKGRVIAVLAGRPTEYLEVFVDNPLDLEPGMTAPVGYTTAATLATMLPTLGPAVAELHAKQDGSDLVMILRTVGASGGPHQIRVRLGVADNLEGKLARLLAELETRGDRIQNITSIDLSTSNTITS